MVALRPAPCGAVALLLAPLVAAATASTASPPPPLRIMPFGDSITVFGCSANSFISAADHPIFNPLNMTSGQNDQGTGFPFPTGTFFLQAPGGYRGYLGVALADAVNAGSGPAWTFAGSQFLCGQHEGYSGETVAWLANRTTAIMTNAQPDIVLFQAGTNDFFWPEDDPHHGTRSPEILLQRLRQLLDRAFAAVPATTFLLSTITHIFQERCKYYDTAHWHPGNCPSDMQANIEAYNKLLPGVVSEYQRAGHDIHLHDGNPAEGWDLESDYWVWGIHFNATGFEKMAQKWSSSIRATAKWKQRAPVVCACPAFAPVPSCCHQDL